MESASLVLVHGGWAGSWAWERVAPALLARGHRVATPDLPGRAGDGASVADLDLEVMLASLAPALGSSGERVVLVGHSSGGMLISALAERYPERVARLVYVCAYLPQSGDSILSLGQADPHQRLLENLEHSADGKTTRIRAEALRELLFDDCSDADTRAAVARFTDAEPMTLAVTPIALSAARFGSVPKTYIECSRDKVISVGMQREMHTRAGCDRVFQLETGHSPHYAAPEELAQCLLECT